jgi:protein-S-isoprenylcysteine O-methyltransferase Ste14
MVALGNFLFRHRNLVFPAVLVAIVLLDRPRYAFGSRAWDRALDTAAILCILAGQALRVLVIGLDYIVRGGRGGKVYAEDLVTGGIFAHSRNPLYVGNIAIFVGLLAILNSPLGWVAGVPAVLVAYVALVLAEEEFLRGKFGAPYEAYCRDVNRFLPSWEGLSATIRSMPFDWRRVIRKEYGSTFAWITAVIALLVWERTAVEGSASVRADLPAYTVAWLAALGLWAVARFLKKTKRLSD